jgi:hypothetical protein
VAIAIGAQDTGFACQKVGETEFMPSTTVQVEAARIPDRDRLVQELRNAGLDARPVEEVCIEVPCGDDTEAACDDLLAHAESLITSIGAPFVPIKHDGVIYIRPPLS